MNSITQEHDFGCGLACVAFVTANTYSTIVSYINREQAAQKGFYCKELCLLLKRFGLDYSHRHVNSCLRSTIYKEGTIVFIKRSKRYPAGHYLVRHNTLWMDSWINFPKDRNIANAISGFRKRLPGKVQYILFKKNLKKRFSDRYF